jgi:hypothetical protein
MFVGMSFIDFIRSRLPVCPKLTYNAVSGTLNTPFHVPNTSANSMPSDTSHRNKFNKHDTRGGDLKRCKMYPATMPAATKTGVMMELLKIKTEQKIIASL